MRAWIPAFLTVFLFVGSAAASELTQESVNTLSRLLTASVSDRDAFEVSSSSELKAVIALEGDKAVLGCEADSSSCLAEVAGAMGARFVVFGQLGDVAESLFLTLQLFDSESGKNAARVIVERKTVRELIDGLPAAVDKLVQTGELMKAKPKDAKLHLLVLDLQLQAGSGRPDAATPGDGIFLIGGAVAALGVATVIGSAVVYALALGSEAAAVAEEKQVTAAEHLDTRDTQAWVATGLLIGGATLFVVGGAAAGTSFLWGE